MERKSGINTGWTQGWYASIGIRLLLQKCPDFFFQFRQVVYHYTPKYIGRKTVIAMNDVVSRIDYLSGVGDGYLLVHF